jgi:hypothetical protein
MKYTYDDIEDVQRLESQLMALIVAWTHPESQSEGLKYEIRKRIDAPKYEYTYPQQITEDLRKATSTLFAIIKATNDFHQANPVK